MFQALTALPPPADAEGNGDSISAAVQAERIALLTSVLAQTNLASAAPSPAPRAHSLTPPPPSARRAYIDLAPHAPPQGHALALGHAPYGQQQSPGLAPPPMRMVHRSQSHLALGQQYAAQQNQPPVPYAAPSPIYQTSGHRRPSPLPSPAPHFRGGAQTQQAQTHAGNHMAAPAPLLPAFLQDIVQSPALSPTSTTTSSAELSSLEEYEEQLMRRPMASAALPRARGDSGASAADAALAGAPLANIWRLDGTESKSLSAFALPNHEELVGARVGGETLRV